MDKGGKYPKLKIEKFTIRERELSVSFYTGWIMNVREPSCLGEEKVFSFKEGED
jgi:hypothetical protein